MSNEPAAWTIDRLAHLTAAVLATGAHAPQPNGRIREVPDVRTIRWYTTIGLLDRPAAMRGRTALYGRRHLAQLVAIKRLQAEGLTLTGVQERLLGADGEAVERIAMLPADVDGLLGAEGSTQGTDNAAADRSAAGDRAAAADKSAASDQAAASDRAAAADRAAASDQAATAAADRPAARDAVAANRAAADRSADAADRSTAGGQAADSPSRARFWSARPVSQPSGPVAESVPAGTHVPPLVPAVRLSADVTLLLAPGRVPDAADRAAISVAARPLLDLLHRLGLSEA